MGAHKLLARLGAGGMGQVYLGRSPGGRLVAIKVVRDEIVDHPEALARFRREVETVRAVRSAYTANLIDASLDAPPYWLATEYVSGPTLSQAVRERGPFPAETCKRLFAALAEGLASVHAYGVTHRDLKPQNVILSPQGPQLIDFGIARGAEQTALTQDGLAPGTPGYTAPEVLMRNEVGDAADIFALGATLAYAATGRAPYGAGDSAGVSYRAVHDEIDVDGVEPGLAALIRACVAKGPADRPGPAEIIRLCAVDSALVDDPVYGPLAGPGDSAARIPVPQTPNDLPTAGPGLGHAPAYVPTEGAVTTPQRGRRRASPWLVAAAVGLVVGTSAVAGTLLLQEKEKEEGNSAKGNQKGEEAVSPSAPTPDPASGQPQKKPQNKPPEPPPYIEQTAPSRDSWQPGDEGCNLPPEERSDLQFQFQFSVSDADDELVQSVTGKARIGYRLKFPPEEEGPYYLSATVKPPHEIDSGTGRPIEGLLSDNLGLGYSSKPVDLAAGEPTEWKFLTYPDDFTETVRGEPRPAIPAGNDPGNWTLLFHHVKGPKEYTSIVCHGFEAK